MKTSINYLSILIVSVLFLSACGQGSQSNSEEESTDTAAHKEIPKEENHDEQMLKGNQMEDTDNPELSEASFSSIDDQQASALLEAYLELKNALVSSSSEEAKNSAKEMTELLDGKTDSNLFKTILQSASNILESNEIESIREHFEGISEHMYQIVKAKNTGKTVYKQYCPMAFDNKGAFWISADEEVKNPYFGDKMLKCGKVEETIQSN